MMVTFLVESRVSRQKNKKTVSNRLPFFVSKSLWRKERDSNPRSLAAQRFSRPPQSTTLPSFRAQKYNGNFFFPTRSSFLFSNSKASWYARWNFGDARRCSVRFADHGQTTIHGARTDAIALRIQIYKYFTVLFLKQTGIIIFNAGTFTRVDIFDG